MNPLVDRFNQILFFAKNYGLPETKKRAILREYLQVKILDSIYKEKLSLNLFFVGGTSLRLLHGLDRFSEDLDFDVDKISEKQIKGLMSAVSNKLKKENIVLDFYHNSTRKRSYFEFRFSDLLHQLRISQNFDEKLTIKFDFERFWRGHKRETSLLKKYGLMANIVTVSLNQILAQKFYAYINRKQTLPRDIYDIIWLIAQEAKIDKNFCRANKIFETDLIKTALEKFLKEKKALKSFTKKLKPFLIDEANANKLNLFPEAINKIG